MGFDAGADVVQDFTTEGEVFGTLVCSRCVALFDRHEGADEGREFVDAAFVLDLVVAGHLDFVASGDEGQFGTDGDTYHTELETGTVRYGWLCRLRWCVRFGDYQLVVLIHCDDGIVQDHCLVLEDFQSEFRLDIEELTVLADTKVRQAVDSLVNLLLNHVILQGLKGGVNFKRQWDSSVIQLLGANIDRSGTFANLDPVFTEAGVGEYVNVAGFFAHGVVVLV